MIFDLAKEIAHANKILYGVNMEDGNSVAELERDTRETNAEIAWELGADDRKAEALDNIHDREALRRILDDEELAPHLSECFRELEAAGLEVFGKNLLHVEAILRHVSRMERQCFQWELDRMERET